MSVINQLLIDLERRRAGPNERGALPAHVRALPDNAREAGWGWIAGGAAVAGVLLGAAWFFLAGYETAPVKPDRPAARSGTEATIERVVTASAGVAPRPAQEDRIESLLLEPPASRMSFELSMVPEDSDESAARRAAEPPAAEVQRAAAADRSGRAEAGESAKKAAGAAPRRPEIRKHERPPTPHDLAENEYRKGAASLQQGRTVEAREQFEAALDILPEHHGARQGLIGLLVKSGQFGEAERLLQEGLAVAPAQLGFTVTLARLQVDRGDNAQAIATMQAGLPYAQGNPDYAAFLAALLQRQGRHEEAVVQFQAALRAKPAPGVWWLGLGMSLQAVKRTADAQEAYRRARASGNLHPELAALAEQRLRQLQ
jgi:MSHA biogenesis protein MshN